LRHAQLHEGGEHHLPAEERGDDPIDNSLGLGVSMANSQIMRRLESDRVLDNVFATGWI